MKNHVIALPIVLFLTAFLITAQNATADFDNAAAAYKDKNTPLQPKVSEIHGSHGLTTGGIL
jgi:hypothetical protein